MFYCCGGVPVAGSLVVELVDEDGEMSPRQLSNSLLDNCLPRPGACDGAHVVQVAAGESPHVGELRPQIGGKSIDHPAAPPCRVLTVQDCSTDIPVQHQQLRIDGAGGLQASSTDLRL